jgi:hypothetical protein
MTTLLAHSVIDLWVCLKFPTSLPFVEDYVFGIETPPFFASCTLGSAITSFTM